MSRNKQIHVGEPYLPPFREIVPLLEQIWSSGRLSNRGFFHQEFETELANYLDIPHVSLFSNCTTGLLVALKTLSITGEVITTPFSFAASTNVLKWSGLEPVFVDINPHTFNIDTNLIENAITENTTAILAVHAYGNPCDVEKIDIIAKKYSLKVIYDGAASFGSQYNDKSILSYGDLSVVSFHATKVLNTFEGGAILCFDPLMKQRIDKIRNFGLGRNNLIEEIGINGKMSEFNAALGITQLKYYQDTYIKRLEIAGRYNEEFSCLDNIEIPNMLKSNYYNYSYYPILISRELNITVQYILHQLEKKGIYAKRYYYPLLIENKSMHNKFHNASDISERILCLPLYPNLTKNDQQRVINEFKFLVT